MMMLHRDPYTQHVGLTEGGIRFAIAIVSAVLALGGSFVGVLRFVHYGDIATHSELMLHESAVAAVQRDIERHQARQDTNIAVLLARAQLNNELLCALTIAPAGGVLNTRLARAIRVCIANGVTPR